MKALSKEKAPTQRPLDFLQQKSQIDLDLKKSNLDFLIQKKPITQDKNNLDFLIPKRQDRTKNNLDFLIPKRDENRTKNNLDFLIQKDDTKNSHSLDFLVRKPENTKQIEQKTINDISDILSNNSLNETQKIDTIHSYLEQGIKAGWFVLDVAKSFLTTSCKMLAMMTIFYSLGSIAAAAATAGSAGQFLSTLVSLGYGAVALSGPLLGMLTKGLGENLIKNLGSQATIAGVLHAAKKAGATKFLDKKLDDGYVKSFFIRLGVNPTNVTNETVVKELTNVFLTVAPSVAGMAGLLPGGMMFLVGDPITALTLNYTMRAGVTAYSGAPSLSNVVRNMVSSTAKAKNRVASEFLTTNKNASEMKVSIDNAVKEEFDLQILVDAELKTQKAVINEGIDKTLFVADEFKQNQETQHAISVGKAVGLGAVGVAFGLAGGTSTVMGIIAPSLATIASSTLDVGMNVASSSVAQTFVVDALMKKGLKTMYQKMWQGTNVAREKQKLLRELRRNYRNAIKNGDEKLKGHFATNILYTLYGFGTVYDSKSIEKLGKPFLMKIASEGGIKNVKDMTIDQLRGAILARQYENLNKISDSVTQVTTGIAISVASHVLVQGVRTYNTGEFQDLINKANVLSSNGNIEVLKTAKDLSTINAKLSADAMTQQAELINKAKLTQKSIRDAAMLAEQTAKLNEAAMKASEALAKQQAFQDALNRRLQTGKTVGGTTLLQSGAPITGYSFSTKELLDKIDQEFGDTKFASLLDVFANTAASTTAGKILDYVPGMSQLRNIGNSVMYAQYAQSSVNILEKVAQLGKEGGVSEVLESGFKGTYAETFEGVQSLTLENAAKLAKENLGEVGAAFETFVKGRETVKSDLAAGIKNVLVDMLKNDVPLTSNEIYTRVGKLLLVGDSSQVGTKAEVISTVGKNIYEFVMGKG